MNSKTVQQLKTELLTKKDSLMSLQAQNNKADVEQDSALKDSVDRSDAEEAWFTKERMSQHWKLELAHIQTALMAIENGTFGICTECDSEIPVKRLRVRPDATLCLYCQEAMEKEMGPNRNVRPASAPLNLFH
jgi:DnaK suppressor protein